MRPGLVAVGTALLVLAGATVSAVYLIPQPGPASEETTVIQPTFVPAHGGGQRSVGGENTSSGTLHFSWSSTVPLAVALYRSSGCPGGAACALGAVVASWPANDSGDANLSGSLAFPLVVVWSNGGTGAGAFQAETVETYHAAGNLPTVTALLVDGTAATIGAIGAVAVFLGLFLRGNVYRRPPDVGGPGSV